MRTKLILSIAAAVVLAVAGAAWAFTGPAAAPCCGCDCCASGPCGTVCCAACDQTAPAVADCCPAEACCAPAAGCCAAK